VSRSARAHPPGARALSLPAESRAAIEAALGAAVAQVQPVSGGCVSPSFRVRLADGRMVFVKTAPRGAAGDMFEKEARSLAAIAATRTLRVPGVLAAAAAWLALEWLEPGAPAAAPGAGRPGAGWDQLGRDLARLHRHRHDSYGWPEDNYIGPLPQANDATSSWSAFWGERRLRPQLGRAARRLGGELTASCERLVGELEERLRAAQQEGASLLHGDLWHGNVHMTAAGPAVLDPSSYHGHREVDLAMAELFGGFPAAFRTAYEAEWPLLAGAAARVPIYQLYYLLVHVNLFGAGYVASTARAVRSALALSR
jgi:fructosamine-3-kinase